MAAYAASSTVLVVDSGEMGLGEHGCANAESDGRCEVTIEPGRGVLRLTAACRESATPLIDDALARGFHPTDEEGETARALGSGR